MKKLLQPLLVMASLLTLSAYAEEPIQISEDCLAEGARNGLVFGLQQASSRELKSARFGSDDDNPAGYYVEGDDILINVIVTYAKGESANWYYVRVQNAQKCTLAQPKLYSK